MPHVRHCRHTCRSRLDMCASRRRAQRSSRFGFSAKCRVYTYTYTHGEKEWMTRPRQFVLLYCVCACLFSFWAQRALFLLFVKEGIHHPTSPEKNREAMLGAGGVPVVPMIIFTTVTVARTVLRFQQQSSPHIQKSAFPKTNSLSFSLSLLDKPSTTSSPCEGIGQHTSPYSQIKHTSVLFIAVTAISDTYSMSICTF